MKSLAPVRPGPKFTPHGLGNTGRVGAVSELVACADLMRRGFHVFRSQSPTCPCDLIVYKNAGRLIRVEVRTATIHPTSGMLSFALDSSDNGRADVYALVVENVTGYLPERIIAPDFPFSITDAKRRGLETVLSSPLPEYV